MVRSGVAEERYAGVQSMSVERYSSGSKFEKLFAYSRATADEKLVHISGTVGSDPETGQMPDDVQMQLSNIFGVIETALSHFGATYADVLRTRIYITSTEALTPLAAVLRRHFGDCPPANTTLICAIPAPGAQVEIEVTARRPTPQVR
jgi:enamine deaminase RidA (YjgF/YER057c/UK114 family)